MAVRRWRALNGMGRLLTAVALALGSPVAGSGAAGAAPNGTWLSQPQIWFYSSSDTLPQVMALIRAERYRLVFLDVRNVADAVQRRAAQEARNNDLVPVVWVQSPQYRRLSVPDLVHEARHGDGIQVDDHFFAHYTLADFYRLRALYGKPIFCSIQPFQAALVPPVSCHQLDVQCYVAQGFQACVQLADRLGAVVSLSTANTLGRRASLGGRLFNTFLWPMPETRWGSGLNGGSGETPRAG